jgi:hypothetical protein
MDKRLVQTAVIGGPGADIPVILPEDYSDLDQFREHYADAHFFCGVLLGGCGRPLTTKRYEDRTCHFAHLADAEGPSTCSRGAHSADHLYLRRAVHSWLAGHGHDAEGVLLGDRDSGVEFRLDSGVWLRFHLSGLSQDERAEAEERARREGGAITWFVPAPREDSPDPGDGALLVRCQDSGTAALRERRVELGTPRLFAPAAWERLETCAIDVAGHVQTRARRLRGEPPVAPRTAAEEQPSKSQPWTPRVPRSKPRRAPREEPDKAVSSALERGAIAAAGLRGCGLWGRKYPEHLARAIAGGQAAAEHLAELGTHYGELNDLLKQAYATQARLTGQQKAAVLTPRKELELDELADLGQIAERVLIQVARERRQLTWRALCGRMHRDDLADADQGERAAILAETDRGAALPQRPLLSALVKHPGDIDDDPFWAIAHNHGRKVPVDQRERAAIRKREIELIYLAWPPPIQMPPSPRPARGKDKGKSASPRPAKHRNTD